MSTNKKLGRGLDALLGAAAGRRNAGDVAAGGAKEVLKDLAVDLIQPGRYQPRQDMNPDALQELAASIRAQGVVQPIVVRPIGAGKYEIIAGERRWRACQIAGLHQVPSVIRDVPDQAAIAMALIENIQREDLNPVEEAVALQRLLDEFGLTHQQVGDAVGRSRAAVSNLLRLLQLHPEVRRHLELGALEMGHARALLSLDDEVQMRAANEIIRKGLSVRETEALVRRLLNPANKPKSARDPNITRLENELAERVGAKIHIQHKNSGNGQVVIRYNSLDELDGILAHIK